MGGSFSYVILFFFFNDTATTEIYTLSLHDALPISMTWCSSITIPTMAVAGAGPSDRKSTPSELQSPKDLVCRLLLEKKKKKTSWLECERASGDVIISGSIIECV